MTRVVPFEILFEQVNESAVADDTVTVAVSHYNYGRFLPECLDSMAAQTHPRLDLVVVDDASTMESSVRLAREWIESHASRFGRALLLRHRRNQGLAQARNTAFGESRSDLVFVIDADDQAYPRAIARLFEAMRDTGSAAAYTQLEFFGVEERLGSADVWRKEWFEGDNYIDATSLISKRAWQEVGGYTHIEGGWEDYDFWCKFVEKGLSAAYVPEILCRYRQHPSSMMRTETTEARNALIIEVTLRHPWLKLKP